jgi:hypothetical protein
LSYLLSANTYLLNIYIQTYVLSYLLSANTCVLKKVLCVSLGLVRATRESRFSYLLSANTCVLKKVPPVLVTVTLHNVGELTLSPVSLNVTGSMSVRCVSIRTLVLVKQVMQSKASSRSRLSRSMSRGPCQSGESVFVL